MENYIPISFLNDFIFCPRSIYFHQLYSKREQLGYQEKPQIEGRQAHQAIDSQAYSTRKSVLQGIPVYSEIYRLHGKIDIFDETKGLLTERKKLIKHIYDGYVFQLYGQFHCLTEMGYQVRKLRLYSMDTNKVYPVRLPEDDKFMQQRFENLIRDINSYNLSSQFHANPHKCVKCIYSNLCDEMAET